MAMFNSKLLVYQRENKIVGMGYHITDHNKLMPTVVG